MDDFDIFQESLFDCVSDSRASKADVETIARCIAMKPCFIVSENNSTTRNSEKSISIDDVEENLHINVYAECKVQGIGYKSTYIKS